MRVVAITMVRDEADIIETSVGHLLTQGARVIVADNLSTDGTGVIALALGAEVVLDPDPAYQQSKKMSALAAQYAQPGDWVIPFDADEEWSGLANLTDAFDAAPVHPIVQIPGDDGWIDGEAELHPKVAFRWQPGCVIAEGNHAVTGAGPRILNGALTVKHYQYRTLEQVKRKVRNGAVALDLAGHPEGTGTHWRNLARLTDDQLAAWWESYCHRSPR